MAMALTTNKPASNSVNSEKVIFRLQIAWKPEDMK